MLRRTRKLSEYICNFSPFFFVYLVFERVFNTRRCRVRRSHEYPKNNFLRSGIFQETHKHTKDPERPQSRLRESRRRAQLLRPAKPVSVCSEQRRELGSLDPVESLPSRAAVQRDQQHDGLRHQQSGQPGLAGLAPESHESHSGDEGAPRQNPTASPTEEPDASART
jgi:hypothetical protein